MKKKRRGHVKKEISKEDMLYSLKLCGKKDKRYQIQFFKSHVLYPISFFHVAGVKFPFYASGNGSVGVCLNINQELGGLSLCIVKPMLHRVRRVTNSL